MSNGRTVYVKTRSLAWHLDAVALLGTHSADIIKAQGNFPYKMPETCIASETENSEKP
jgi:hypothetical protein